MPDPTIIEPLLDRFRAPRPRRTASLVVSFFGDAIALCDGSVWLGTLADFLAPLDIDKNALRVSMHRLARDGWLASRREGRKAYYSLTPTGDNVFREAADRIYGPVTAPETGRIETAILTETTDRSGVRQTHQKEGWGALAPNVLVRPAGEAATNAQAEAIHLISSPDPETLRRMVAAAWPIGDLAGQIDAFINLFQPIDQALFTEAELPPGDCLLLRA